MRTPEESINRLTRAGMDPEEAAEIVAQLDPDSWISCANRISGDQLRYRVSVLGCGDYWYLISE